MIHLPCSSCNRSISLNAGDVIVRNNMDNFETRYIFQCPLCRYRVSEVAEQAIVDILVTAGCQVQVWRYPPEMQEEKSGLPINENDVDSFVKDMDDPDWFDKLIGLV